MNGMVWMGIQLFQKVTSFKLNTTLISLAEFVSLINFTLLPQALPENAKKWARISLFSLSSQGQPSARNTAFHLLRKSFFHINLEVI